MSHEDAEALTGLLDSNYRLGLAFDEYGKSMWTSFFMRHDVVEASEAVRRLVERQKERATIADVRGMISNIQAAKNASRPRLAEAEFVRELPNWFKGWLVARARADARVWPEQRPGFDALQREHSDTRTYVWPEQDMMPDEDRAKYEAEGEPLTAAQLGTMLGKLTGMSA